MTTNKEYKEFIKNKKSLIGKSFYFYEGFDVPDLCIFTVRSFYGYTDDPHAFCNGWHVIPDGENEFDNEICWKLSSLFSSMNDVL